MFITSERRRILSELFREQRKLEAMVMEHFESGNRNMGNNKKILMQSGLLDKLVVDEMMLNEMDLFQPEKTTGR